MSGNNPLLLKRPAAGLVLALAMAALASGCAHRDSIKVGAIPDDYRTNHPIVIAERLQTVDIPVGSDDRGVTVTQKTALSGFLSNYDRDAAPTVEILVPSGSRNELAAQRVASGLIGVLGANGINRAYVTTSAYQVAVPDVSAPIRVSYLAMRAQTNKCGRWPADLADSSENKHWANFGCSYQNNLAAQVANPADLLGPRPSGEIDAERRDVTIGDYRARVSVFSPETDY